MAATDLLTGHPHDFYNTAYWGDSPSRAREALRRWSESFGGRTLEEYSFLDVGRGKGRRMLIASEFPFREVIGVELNAGLAAGCDGNEAAPLGPCVVFLCNPFGAPVLAKVLAGFEEQFQGQACELDVLYLSPEFADVFQLQGGYEPVWQANLAQTDEEEAPDAVAPGWQPCHAHRRVARSKSVAAILG